MPLPTPPVLPLVGSRQTGLVANLKNHLTRGGLLMEAATVRERLRGPQKLTRSENCTVRGSVVLLIWPKFAGGLVLKLPVFTPK